MNPSFATDQASPRHLAWAERAGDTLLVPWDLQRREFEFA